MLATLLDEAMHACFWDLDDDCVDQASEAIAKFLRKCGVRVTMLSNDIARPSANNQRAYIQMRSSR